VDPTYFAQAASMYFLSLWKTYLGPLIAAGAGFSYVEMLAFNLSAAISSSTCMLWLTDQWMKRRKTTTTKFNGNLRRALRFWKKYGQSGSVLLAPILIGIPTYALIARRFKTSKRNIIAQISLITFLWCSAIYWAGIQGLLVVATYYK